MSDSQEQPSSGPGSFSIRRLVGIIARGDIGLAMGVVCILVVLVLPMPSWLLDFSLAVSITFSIIILMTCLFIERPLDFSTFPTVLLIATMLRLSLNLASTRLILSEGHTGPGAAGDVIEAFGNFVMGGNFVIGIIVFLILRPKKFKKLEKKFKNSNFFFLLVILLECVRVVLLLFI